MDGIQSVLQLREIAGLMKPPLPKPDNMSTNSFTKGRWQARSIDQGVSRAETSIDLCQA